MKDRFKEKAEAMMLAYRIASFTLEGEDEEVLQNNIEQALQEAVKEERARCAEIVRSKKHDAVYADEACAEIAKAIEREEDKGE